jgi:hypothetical protein
MADCAFEMPMSSGELAIARKAAVFILCRAAFDHPGANPASRETQNRKHVQDRQSQETESLI